MQRTRYWSKLEAVTLSALLILSMSAVALSGTALGAVGNDSLVVTDAPVQPDGSITVEGETGNSQVTFLIQDPDTGAASTHTVSGLSTSGTFSTSLDLASDFGIDYSDGEATLMADEGAEFVTAEDTTSFRIDTQDPTVDIGSPADGADRTSVPTISGSASDDRSVDRVELSLQNESTGQYYNANTGNWENSRAWLTASGTNDWSYDTTGLTDDGTYEVAVRVFDDAGNSRSYFDGPQSYSDDNTLHATYTVDTAAPAVTAVDATELNDNDTVEVGDTVNVSATVTDATAGVDTVTVDSSSLVFISGWSTSSPETAYSKLRPDVSLSPTAAESAASETSARTASSTPGSVVTPRSVRVNWFGFTSTSRPSSGPVPTASTSSSTAPRYSPGPETDLK